ncbi:MAG: hypothetical protein ABIH37_05455 [archaeon]
MVLEEVFAEIDRKAQIDREIDREFGRDVVRQALRLNVRTPKEAYMERLVEARLQNKYQYRELDVDHSYCAARERVTGGFVKRGVGKVVSMLGSFYDMLRGDKESLLKRESQELTKQAELERLDLEKKQAHKTIVSDYSSALRNFGMNRVYNDAPYDRLVN